MSLKIFANYVEPIAVNQVYELVKHPALINQKIRIMPDVHYGVGVCIGFTSTYTNKIVPAIVGSDIGCGMLTVNLGQMDVDFALLDEIINTYVPHGRNTHFETVNEDSNLKKLLCAKNIKDISIYHKALGTLGGGNHFIEIDKDEQDNKYLIIHTGSRQLGGHVAKYYQDRAYSNTFGKNKLKIENAEIIKTLKKTGREKEIQTALMANSKRFIEKTKGLTKSMCYLEHSSMDEYLHDMAICQNYAKTNRQTIANIITSHYFNHKITKFKSFETIHNYVDIDAKIIRKGAVSAKKEEPLLIPINMADGCIMAKGLGNADWNYSAPHGAGRIYSRSLAKEKLTLEEYKKSMTHVYSTSVCENTIDEAPAAYKSLHDITSMIYPTAEIIHLLKPVYNFKSKEIIKHTNEDNNEL